MISRIVRIVCVVCTLSVATLASPLASLAASRDAKIEADAADLDRLAAKQEADAMQRLAGRYSKLGGAPLVVGLRNGLVVQGVVDARRVPLNLSYGTTYKLLVATTHDLKQRGIRPPATWGQLQSSLERAAHMIGLKVPDGKTPDGRKAEGFVIDLSTVITAVLAATAIEQNGQHRVGGDATGGGSTASSNSGSSPGSAGQSPGGIGDSGHGGGERGGVGGQGESSGGNLGGGPKGSGGTLAGQKVCIEPCGAGGRTAMPGPPIPLPDGIPQDWKSRAMPDVRTLPGNLKMDVPTAVQSDGAIIQRNGTLDAAPALKGNRNVPDTIFRGPGPVVPRQAAPAAVDVPAARIPNRIEMNRLQREVTIPQQRAR
jgi:hypothetical protein